MTTGSSGDPGTPTSSSKSWIFRKGNTVELVLIGIILAELLYFLWLLLNPGLFRQAPGTTAATPGATPQAIIASADQPAGGGIAIPPIASPVSSPVPVSPSIPAAAPTTPAQDDTRGRAAAAKGEDLHVYLSIDNAGAATTLTGASSPQASSSSLWQLGLAGAAPVSATSIPVAANGVTLLDDEHGWIALDGLTADFRKGDRIEVTLTFEDADPVTLSVPIYRTSDTAAANREAPVTAGDLSLGAFWAEPFAPGK